MNDATSAALTHPSETSSRRFAVGRFISVCSQPAMIIIKLQIAVSPKEGHIIRAVSNCVIS